jgi:site-specific recombinase XerD
MVWAPDSPDLWAPDSATPNRWAPDSGGHLTLGRAVDLFLAAKAAEGAAAKTLEWYGMILRRAVRGLGEDRPIEQLTGPELRAWILELRSTLSPISVAGYVRTLKVLGNWLAAEELAQVAALRTLRKPRVPDKLVEPISDDAMRRLLAVADVRDRAILLLLLDCGLRVSEAAGLRLGDLRPDGTLKVMGKGAKERIVPVGGTARTAIVRYMGQRGAGAPDEPLFLGRRGALDWRGMQQVLKRLKSRAGITGRCSPHSLRHTLITGRCSPHSLRHTFARSYLVNGGDVFSLQRILGHTTLDMVKRYVALAELEIVRRIHAVASPADRLLIGPKVSVILPRAVFRRLTEIGDRTRSTVEQLVGIAAERLAASRPVVPILVALS